MIRIPVTDPAQMKTGDRVVWNFNHIKTILDSKVYVGRNGTVWLCHSERYYASSGLLKPKYRQGYRFAWVMHRPESGAAFDPSAALVYGLSLCKREASV